MSFSLQSDCGLKEIGTAPLRFPLAAPGVVARMSLRLWQAAVRSLNQIRPGQCGTNMTPENPSISALVLASGSISRGGLTNSPCRHETAQFCSTAPHHRESGTTRTEAYQSHSFRCRERRSANKLRAEGMYCGAGVTPRTCNVFRRRRISAIKAGDRDTILAMTAIVTWLSVHKRTTSPSRICTNFTNSCRDSRTVDNSRRVM
jgi:hypothetical protein